MLLRDGEEVLSDIIGHVDALDRPVVSLSIPGQEDSFLVTVDTGFNRQLLIHSSDIARLHCDFVDITMAVELAGRERRMLEVARSQILWFGHPRDVEVLVGAGGLPRPALADEPIGLIGTSLLRPHKLVIDFAARSVVISENSD